MLFLAVVIAPAAFLFCFHTFCTQVVLILISINGQYLKNVASIFEKEFK